MILNTKKGFTLIELLTVTAILTLLMSMVFFKVTEAKKKGEDAHMKAEATQVSRAVMAFKEDNGGKAPGHLTVTGGPREGSEPYTYVEGHPTTGDEYTAAMQKLVTGGYLSEIPTSPAGGDYSYIISDDGDEAVFAVNLNYEDRSSGGGSGSGSRNSCELTKVTGSSSGDGGAVEPCTEPEQPPEFIDVYGGSIIDPISLYEYTHPQVYIAYSPPRAPLQYLSGPCNADNMVNFINYNMNPTCIDLPAGLAQAQEVCDILSTTSCDSITDPNARAMLYYPWEVDAYEAWRQDYEEPYVQGYADYEYCKYTEFADQYDEFGDWIGGGVVTEGNDICGGSQATDYCTCM